MLMLIAWTPTEPLYRSAFGGYVSINVRYVGSATFVSATVASGFDAISSPVTGGYTEMGYGSSQATSFWINFRRETGKYSKVLAP